MAIQAIQGYNEDPLAPQQVSAGPSYGTSQLQISAAGHRGAVAIFEASETCNLRYVGFGVRTVTTGATGLDVRLETVDATTGMPTGTLVGANTNVSVNILSTDDNTFFEAQLTADAAVTAGTLYALVVVNPATPGNMQLSCFMDDQAHFPYPALYNGTSWAAVSGTTCVATFRKDTGAVMFLPQVVPIYSTNTRTFNSSTNPNHAALRQRRPYPGQCCGFWAWVDLDGDCKVLLVGADWDGTDGNALAYTTLDKDVESVTAGGLHYHFWPPAQRPVLAKDTYYRLVFQPTTTTSLSIYEMLVLNSTLMPALPYGAESHLSTANNPNDNTDWTDTTTSRPWCGLLINGYDDGAGGGGGTTNIFVIGD